MKLSEWTGGSGYHYVADTSDLGNNSGVWYAVPRALGIELDEYVRILVNYGAKINFDRENRSLIFSWLPQDGSKAHKFLLDMNRRLQKVR